MTPSAWNSIQMVLDGVRTRPGQRQRRQQQLNFMARFDESQRHEPAAQAVISRPGARSAFAVRYFAPAPLCSACPWVRRVAPLLPLGVSTPFRSSVTAASGVEFAQNSRLLVSPLFCLIFAAAPDFSGASVSGLKRIQMLASTCAARLLATLQTAGRQSNLAGRSGA
uniref:Transposase n=1 Tax=Macrostomum lignano TaxID=282301 RepID=A0A1I8FDY4_9PLAT